MGKLRRCASASPARSCSSGVSFGAELSALSIAACSFFCRSIIFLYSAISKDEVVASLAGVHPPSIAAATKEKPIWASVIESLVRTHFLIVLAPALHEYVNLTEWSKQNGFPSPGARWRRSAAREPQAGLWIRGTKAAGTKDSVPNSLKSHAWYPLSLGPSLARKSIGEIAPVCA